MSQTGYTPIQLYYSTTAAAVPVNTNLASGELAINITDGKLYYKDNSGVVKLLASNATSAPVLSFQTSLSGLTPSTATTGVVTLAGTLGVASGGTGQVTLATGALGYGQGTSAHASLAIGTAGQILTVNSGATAPQWSTLSGVAVTTFSAGTTGFTPSSATSGAVTLAGTLATTNGGTGLTSFTSGGLVYASSTSALTTGSTLLLTGTILNVVGTNSAVNVDGGGVGGIGNTLGVVGTSYGYVGTSTATPLVFNTSNTERARIESSGNLLVNTTTGYGKFTVASTAGTGKVLLDNYATVPTTENVMSIYADATNAYIQSYNNGYKNICIAHNGGNVGIGTSSPTVAQLVIKGDGATGQIRLQATTNTNQGLSFIYNYSSQFGQINCDESGVNQLDLWYTALNHKFGRNTSSANMILDSSGNLVIGATSASTKLDVVKQGNSSGGTMMLSGSKTNSAIKYGYMTGAHYTSTTYPQGVGIIGCTALSGENKISIGGDPGEFLAATSIGFFTAANTTTAGGTERVRISSEGYVGIKTTNPTSNLEVYGLFVNATTPSPQSLRVYYNSSYFTEYTELAIQCFNNTFKVISGTTGGVQLTNGATSWAAVSDARLKNVTGTYTNALSDIAQIEAVKFTWKSDEDNKPQVGVIAQSVLSVVPEAVVLENDSQSGVPVDTQYYSVRYTELIPLMIASIQELKTQNESLKARLDAANL